MVECVADISSSSLLEFVSQIFLSYPEKLKKENTDKAMISRFMVQKRQFNASEVQIKSV